MSLLPKLLEVRHALNTGLHPDQHDMQDFVWANGSNVQFTSHGVKKMLGWSAPVTPLGSTPVRGMGQVLIPAGQHVFWGDQTDLYMWNAVSVTNEGTSYTGNLNETSTAIASTWSFASWGNWMVATNGVDDMQIWKGTSFAALAGTPPATAEILVKVNVHLLAFNLSGLPTDYAWCDVDDPEDWVPVAENSAGTATIREFENPIVAALNMGAQVAVYTKNEMALVSYIGAPRIFGHKFALKGIGAVSKAAVVAVGRQHYGLCEIGFFMTDGQSQTWIDDDIRDTFLAEFSTAQKSKVNAWHNRDENEVRWNIPALSNEPNAGWGYNYKTRVWTRYGEGKTASIERLVFSYPLSADSDGNVLYENYANDADGSALTAWIESKATPIFTSGSSNSSPKSLEDYVKFFEAIKLGLMNVSGSGLKVGIGVQDSLDDSISWQWFQYAEFDMNVVYPKVAGRWMTLRIESDQLGDAWELQTMTVHGKTIGGPIG